MSESHCSIGTDVGGTFTDLVFVTAAGEVHCFKVPSTPSRPGESILTGVEEIRAALNPDHATWRDAFHTHSSTVATNALIERRGARVGLITTLGFRDLFELQRLAIPHPMRFDSRRPAPLVPREHVREVGGRIGPDGDEVDPLDEPGVLQATRELAAAGVEIAVVTFMHSYRNPAHERRARELVEREGIDLRLELSSDVWPQAREYERAVLTAINACVRPIIESYVGRLTDGLGARGLAIPARVARSNGGAELARTMRERPVVALLSGPAAGVAGAADAAEDAGWPDADLMTLDVGGTSADIGVIRDGKPVLSSEEIIGEFPGADPDGRGIEHRRRWRLDHLARQHRVAESWAAQRRRRSRTGLLRQRFAGAGADRCVPGGGVADAGPASGRQAGVAAGTRARRARYDRQAVGLDAGASGRRSDPDCDCDDGGGGDARAGAARRRCAALPHGGLWRRRAAAGRADGRGDRHRYDPDPAIPRRAERARRRAGRHRGRPGAPGLSPIARGVRCDAG